jgi:hypothetical protein
VSSSPMAAPLYVPGGGAAVPPPAPVIAIECYDITESGISFPGPAIDPNDIGPAVQAAANAALAAGGGQVCIPKRTDGVSNQWGWQTSVVVNLNTDLNFSLQGQPAGTLIRVTTNFSKIQIGNNGPGIVSVDGLIFTGDPAAGLDCPNVLDINQTRTARLTRCEFWGLDCNSDLAGVVRIIADTVHVEDNIFVGCNFSGTPRKGGVLCISGMRDGCLVTTNRFDTNGIVLDGVLYGKAASPQNGWLWFGGQGPAPPPTQPTYGGVDVVGNHFAQVPQLFQCAFLPDEQDPTFVIDTARCIGNSFNTPTVNLNAGASILSSHCLRLFVRGEFAGAIAGMDAIKIQNCDHLLFQDCRFAIEDLSVNFTGPVGYCEFDECPKVSIPAYNVAGALYGATLTNIANVANVSEKINGAQHSLICDARTLETAPCVALYDANLGVILNGANVQQWSDQSGSGDPNEDLRQVIPARQPPYVAIDAAYNGQASIGPFDPVALMQLQSGGAWVTPPPVVGYVVAVWNTGGAGAEILFRDSGVAAYELYQNGANVLHAFQSVILQAVVETLNTPSITSVSMNHRESTIRKDGLTPMATGDIGTAAPASIEISGGFTFAGNIAYLAFFSARPSRDDEQRLIEALGVRYGKPVSA